MTTRPDLRLKVREELGDETSGSYVWSDALLNAYIGQAIRRFSADLPKESTASLVTVAGQSGYSLPAGCLRVLMVEYPSGSWVRPCPANGGDGSDTERETTWEEYGGQLLLRPAPPVGDRTISLRYLAAYLVANDDVTALDLPPGDEQLVVWLACEAALAWLNKQKDKRQEHRAGFLYPADYGNRYREALRARRSVMGVVCRRLG